MMNARLLEKRGSAPYPAGGNDSPRTPSITWVLIVLSLVLPVPAYAAEEPLHNGSSFGCCLG